MHREYVVTLSQISNDGVDLAVESAEDWIVNPGLLHEFKLALDVAVQTKKMQTAIDTIFPVRVFRTMAVGSTSPQDAMAIRGCQGGSAIRAKRVARIGTPHVRTDRTLETERIAVAIAKIVYGA